MPRVAQREMAAAVEDALLHGGALVVESGTGTGKTFAYLAPIMLSGRRTIISTGTKHLQEQIYHRDLPQVAKVLAGRCAPVDAVLLKGRANYLCRYRLKLHAQQSDLIGEAEARSFAAIEAWAATTESGDIAEASGIGEASPLWSAVTSTADNCLGGQCPDFKECYVVRARQKAMQADIVVVNHHLFFSDLTLKAEGFGELLPQYEAVVFDEAHGLKDIASNFFGFTISGGQVADLLGDIVTAEAEEKSGVRFADDEVAVEKALKKMQRATKKFMDKSVEFATLQSAEFDAACTAFESALAQLEQSLSRAAPSGEGLARCHQRCLLLQERLDTWAHGGDGNLIRWAEIYRATGKVRFRLHGTPLAINDIFAEMMQRHRAAWIFTSATLAVGDDFSAFCKPLGLQDAHTHRWESPYNFDDNALLYLPKNMPQPSAPQYADALCATIDELLAASRGRAFCLFTSFDMMHRVYKKLSTDTDWKFLLQGEVPKSELLKRFGAHGNAVLFGTASFWEGVDVVGEKLSCVIIDKLPFAPPDDPVLKSRLQACNDAGENPFMSIQVPQAVIALKQGAGRLIRSETDRGVLALCDPRLVSRGYGKLFRASLPDMPASDEMDSVRAFFANESC